MSVIKIEGETNVERMTNLINKALSNLSDTAFASANGNIYRILDVNKIEILCDKGDTDVLVVLIPWKRKSITTQDKEVYITDDGLLIKLQFYGEVPSRSFMEGIYYTKIVPLDNTIMWESNKLETKGLVTLTPTSSETFHNVLFKWAKILKNYGYTIHIIGSVQEEPEEKQRP